MKSVQSINPFKSQLRQAGAIQTINDIVKAHSGELKVENLPAGRAGKEARPDDPVGSGDFAEFIIVLPG